MFSLPHGASYLACSWRQLQLQYVGIYLHVFASLSLSWIISILASSTCLLDNVGLVVLHIFSFHPIVHRASCEGWCTYPVSRRNWCFQTCGWLLSRRCQRNVRQIIAYNLRQIVCDMIVGRRSHHIDSVVSECCTKDNMLPVRTVYITSRIDMWACHVCLCQDLLKKCFNTLGALPFTESSNSSGTSTEIVRACQGSLSQDMKKAIEAMKTKEKAEVGAEQLKAFQDTNGNCRQYSDHMIMIWAQSLEPA